MKSLLETDWFSTLFVARGDHWQVADHAEKSWSDLRRKANLLNEQIDLELKALASEPLAAPTAVPVAPPPPPAKVAGSS